MGPITLFTVAIAIPPGQGRMRVFYYEFRWDDTSAASPAGRLALPSPCP